MYGRATLHVWAPGLETAHMTAWAIENLLTMHGQPIHVHVTNNHNYVLLLLDCVSAIKFNVLII